MERLAWRRRTPCTCTYVPIGLGGVMPSAVEAPQCCWPGRQMQKGPGSQGGAQARCAAASLDRKGIASAWVHKQAWEGCHSGQERLLRSSAVYIPVAEPSPFCVPDPGEQHCASIPLRYHLVQPVGHLHASARGLAGFCGQGQAGLIEGWGGGALPRALACTCLSG